uniref:Uncharacterized protein n=1 Tax=Gracilinema caldarium TaxID=215591 RepID=A0A7C3IDX7_9SPIR
MGLLQRAANASTTSKPDPMAEALVERILRLAPAPNRVYMVLTLLKTYIPFQSALVLEQKNDSFTSLDVIGLDIPALTIGASEILPYLPEKEDSWFSADFIKSWDSLQNKPFNSAQGYLISRASSNAVIIIFIEEPAEKIPLDDATFILSRIHSLFTLCTGTEDKGTPPTLWMNDVFAELLKPGSTLAIGIFEKPEHPDAITKALGAKGRTNEWGNSKFIIVMETSLDPELYFHRIQKSFNIKLLDSFETADSLAAIQRIS